MDKPIENKWFEGVDSLRFILATIVLLSHFFASETDLLNNFTNKSVKMIAYALHYIFNGTAAVIAFFVISGFVIHVSNKRISNIKKFFFRRYLRILGPLSIISAIGILFHHPEKGVVWSLICELAYYSIYPVLIRLKISWERKFLISLAIATLVILIGAKHEFTAFIYQDKNVFHGYYWQLGPFVTWIIGLPCWLLGVIIAEKINIYQNVSLQKLVIMRCIVFATSILLNVLKMEFYLSFVLSMNLFAVLIYYWVLFEVVYFKKNQANHFLEYFGKSSYSLYIVHPVAFIILQLVFRLRSYTILPYLFFIILIAHLFYLVVEYPLHKLAKKIQF